MGFKCFFDVLPKIVRLIFVRLHIRWGNDDPQPKQSAMALAITPGNHNTNSSVSDAEAQDMTHDHHSTNPAVGNIEEGVSERRNESTEDENDARSKKLKEVVREKWTYITCAFAVMGISLTFFGSDIIHSRLSLFMMEVCLAIVCVFLFVVLCVVHHYLKKELRLMADSRENYGPSLCAATGVPYQLILFILIAFLMLVMYVAFAISFIHKKIK